MSARCAQFSYAATGIDRVSRKNLRLNILQDSKTRSNYLFGKTIELPFSTIYQTGKNSNDYYDFQIEGVGSKTLLAEIDPAGYKTIGIDGVAMVANDIVRSGARVILLSDAIHIAKSKEKIVRQIISGVEAGAEMCSAALASGETGDVSEILHNPLTNSKSSLPFDLIVSGLGILNEGEIISGRVAPGDAIIGIESSGIHSNGITLARKILLKNWGGKFEPHEAPNHLETTLIKEMLRPTRIYAKAISEVCQNLKLKAALHITGDGLAKFSRLTEFGPKANSKKRSFTDNSIGFQFDSLGKMPEIFKLIYDTARRMKKPITLQEMFRTFNMGVGFAVVVGKNDTDGALDLFNRHFPTRRIGKVTRTAGVVVLNYEGKSSKIML